MTTLYLKAADEATMKATLADALPGLVGTDDDGNEVLRCYTHRWALDWAIPVVVTEAVLDEDGNVLEPAVMSTDFHANLILLDDSLSVPGELLVDPDPDTPQRVFA